MQYLRVIKIHSRMGGLIAGLICYWTRQTWLLLPGITLLELPEIRDAPDASRAA
jgi:hypothetical protein